MEQSTVGYNNALHKYFSKYYYMNIVYIIGIIILLIIIFIYLFIKKESKDETFVINKDQDETKCLYLSSRGILKSCHIHSSNPISSIKDLIDYDFSKLVDNCSIYVCTSAIPAFVKKIKEINVKFYLVSGDADETCPTDILNNNEFINFIENDKIIAWYAQNCVKEHPKLFKLPIGLDYHSKVGGSYKQPIENEKMMIDIKNKSKPFYDREIKCYSNFHFVIDSSKYGYDRRDAINNIPEELMYYEPTRVDRKTSFENQIKLAFVVSPHGNGLDCHRTWEALGIGCIPIVKTSPLDSLYDDLPVLIVKDWSDVNITLLTKTIEEFKTKKFNNDKLLLKYWTEKFNKL